MCEPPNPNPPRRRGARPRAAALGLALAWAAAAGCTNLREYRNTSASADDYDSYRAAASPYPGFGPLAIPTRKPPPPRPDAAGGPAERPQ